MAVLTNRATGPGVASHIDSASTMLSRLRTLRTPLRNSVELICARWQCRNRSIKTSTATALANRITQSTGPPLDTKSRKDTIRSLYGSQREVQRSKFDGKVGRGVLTAPIPFATRRGEDTAPHLGRFRRAANSGLLLVQAGGFFS